MDLVSAEVWAPEWVPLYKKVFIATPNRTQKTKRETYQLVPVWAPTLDPW